MAVLSFHCSLLRKGYEYLNIRDGKLCQFEKTFHFYWLKVIVFPRWINLAGLAVYHPPPWRKKKTRNTENEVEQRNS